MGASDGEIEDLVQETFYEAHHSLERFEGNSSIDTWVVSIAKGVWLHYKRKQRALMRKAQEASLDQPESRTTRTSLKSTVPSPEVMASNREDLRKVQAVLSGLPQKLCQPLLLQAKGFTYEQIASLLGISPDLASSRIFQARDKLRQKFPERKRTASR